MTWQKYPLKVGHHVLSYIHYKWATRKAPDWQGLYFWFPFAAWGQSFLQIQLYPGISSHGLQRVIWVKKERKKKKKISSISSASSLCVSLQVRAGASSDHSAAKVAKHLPLWLCFQCFRVFGKKKALLGLNFLFLGDCQKLWPLQNVGQSRSSNFSWVMWE